MRLSSSATEAIGAIARQALNSYAPKVQPGANELACRAGCSFCCRSPQVAVSPPEVFAVVECINSLPPPQRKATLARVRTADDATRGLTMAQRINARVPCPLLEDDRCSVYDARPLSCRAAVSLDASACERSFEGTPTPVPTPRAYWDALGESVRGLGMALAKIGMALRGYEFNAALRIAVETPDAPARWAAGEDIFKGAEPAR